MRRQAEAPGVVSAFANDRESAERLVIRGCPGVEPVTPEDRSPEREPAVVKSRRLERMSF